MNSETIHIIFWRIYVYHKHNYIQTVTYKTVWKKLGVSDILSTRIVFL